MQYLSDEVNEQSKITNGMSQLVASVARLRSPNEGCVWFSQQTFQTLRRYLLEEVAPDFAAVEHRYEQL